MHVDGIVTYCQFAKHHESIFYVEETQPLLGLGRHRDVTYNKTRLSTFTVSTHRYTTGSD